MRERSELAVHLLQLVCQRARWTSQQVADSAFLTVAARLARSLLQLRREGADGPTEDGSFEVRISQTDLARFLGVSRQVVNGYLQGWQRQGLVSVGRGRVTVPDAEALKRVAEV